MKPNLPRLLPLLCAAILPATTLAQAPRPPAPNPGDVKKAFPESAPESAPEKRAEKRRKAFKRKKGAKYSLTFEDTDIVEVVKTISNYTGKNFILPQNLRGKITIISQTKVSATEVYAAFLAALEANNLTVYPIGKSFLKIIPKKDGSRSNIPTIVDEDGFVPFNEQLVTRVFRLRHVETDQVQAIVKALHSRDGAMQQFPPNLLIVTDVGLNIRRIQKILDQIDVPGGAGELRIIQVNYAAATDIAAKLVEIFEGQGGKTGGGRGRPAARPKPKGAAGTKADASQVTISRVIADERTNKLIVVADKRSFKKIQEILDELDVPTEAEGQVHVHYLANANAEDLASTLSNLASGSQTSRPGRPRTVRAGEGSSGAGAVSAELFSGDVKISADKATNSLVIVANYKDYRSLAKVIEKLDITRRQVFVEVVIMEVAIDTTDEFGFSFHGGGAPSVGDDVAPVILGTKLGGLDSLGLGSLLGFGGFLAGIQGPALPGTGDLPISIPSFGVVLHALQRDSHVNVLSTPHILTSDNEEAEITVGQNVPFQSGFAPQGVQNLLGAAGSNNPLGALGALGGGLGSFFAPIQRQNVELKLKLTPQINESDFVRLAIETQIEEIASIDRQLGPTTARRTVKTVVVAKDGQTVVIGGLIQERTLESVQKVPILGDIPVLGWLFRSTEVKTIKTNLLIFLTPYVITSPADFRRILDRKLAERQEFVDQFYGVDGNYDAVIDFEAKIGPLAFLHETLLDEWSRPENGGDGAREGDTLIVPDPEPEPAPDVVDVRIDEAPADDPSDDEAPTEDE